MCSTNITDINYGGQTVKNLPAMHETWIQSLSQEDPLEEGMATHSCILAWRIPWTEEPMGYSLHDHKELEATETTWHACKEEIGLDEK